MNPEEPKTFLLLGEMVVVEEGLSEKGLKKTASRVGGEGVVVVGGVRRCKKISL